MRVTLLVVLLFGASSGSRVFQGDCASPRVLCEQVCVAVSQQTYECGCWDGHFLLDDGLSCRAYSAAQYEESREESRSHNMRSKASLTSVTTTSQSSEPPATTTTSAKSIAVASASDKLRKSLVPSLAFSGSNYAEFDIPDDAYLETNITLQFKLDEKRDGILLFAGQLVGPDFIAIAIDGPNIVLRHDCGEGTIEDMYHGEFALGEWHEVRVWRRNCDSTQLRVDDGRRLVDVASQFTNYKGITMDDGVYIGGAPRGIEDLRDKAGTDKGIRGCIRKLVINGQTLMDVEYGVNTAHHADILDTCKRTTKIEESAPSRTHIGYDLTRAGLPILTEEQMAEMTHTSTSTPMTSSTTTTTLPTTTTTAEGVVTSKEKAEGPNWKIAHFNGDSRVVVEPLDGSLDYLELVIQFKSNKPSGVLFSWQSGRKFLVVALENFFMKVYVSLGADVVVLSSENAVSLYRWHKVEIWRSGKGILLKVNRQSWVEAELHSEADDEKTAASMAVGGFEGRLPRAISDQLPGFSGCLKRPRLNGRSLSLGGWGATNVSECLSDPCSAAGCPQTCASVNNEPVCMCEWPHSGDRCQQEAGDEITAMSFGGVSYLELAAEKVMNHVTGNELKLSVDVKLRNFTTHLSQVILSAGDSSLMENDFVELAVDGGRYVRFSMNLGSGVVVLTHPRRLLDERWTTIEVIRKDRHVTLSVNGEDPISSTSPEGAQQLNVYHSLFIGGRPPATAQSSQYPSTTGLHGCVLTVRLADDVIAHPKQATRAVNVADCSV